jgi:hypothetical protein
MPSKYDTDSCKFAKEQGTVKESTVMVEPENARFGERHA